ncbi:MAG TPA: adenosylcobinamide-GDP ribazoletransferase [Sphingobium sp.]|nr:adenosylcobinamide-GDP ribazoletransferase [Sphingobium sp.]
MRGLVLAMQLMTSLPMPQVPAGEKDFAAAIRWFPATGVAVGTGAAAALWLGARVDPWLGALLALLAWVAMTGALHLDGLGDIADGAGAAHGDRARLSVVLADPHIGSFGVVAIVLQMLAKLVLLRLWAEQLPPLGLIGIATIARIGPLAWTLYLPPLHEGLGSRFRSGVTCTHLIGWGAAALCLCLWLPGLFAAALLVPVWGMWITWRIGGISGDGHGAGIEIVESGLLLALLLVPR